MPLLVTISREGSVSTETRRAAVTALAGLVALAPPGAIASSYLANAALVDLGALVECDAQETGCPRGLLRAARTGRDCRHETIASPATHKGRLFRPPLRVGH